MPQVDPEQPQPGNQHERGTGRGVSAIADEPNACQHNPDQVQRSQGDAKPTAPRKMSIASHTLTRDNGIWNEADSLAGLTESSKGFGFLGADCLPLSPACMHTLELGVIWESQRAGETRRRMNDTPGVEECRKQADAGNQRSPATRSAARRGRSPDQDGWGLWQGWRANAALRRGVAARCTHLGQAGRERAARPATKRRGSDGHGWLPSRVFLGGAISFSRRRRGHDYLRARWGSIVGLDAIGAAERA